MNDAPTIYLPESFTFEEDGSYTEDFSIYVDDIDEDELSLSVSGSVNVGIAIDGFIVSFSALQDWYGSEVLTFTVDDSQGRAIASDEVEIIVTPVNDPPVLEEIGYQQTLEDTELVISIIADDIDGDELIYAAASSSTSEVSVEIEGVNVVMVPAENFNGCLLYTSPSPRDS